MLPGLPPEDEAVIQRVRDLAPLLTEAGEEIDTGRCLPHRVSEAIIDAGVFRVAVPKAYGGLDLSPAGCGRVVEELAVADGSAGWCGMIAWQNAALSAGMPPPGAREVFGPRDVAAGVARQTGKAIPVEGGYRITGRWPFASGGMHATWFAGECMVMRGEEPRRDAGGGTIGRFCLVRRADVTIHQTWLTGGLRGTGSNDFSIEDVLVPAERTFSMGVDAPALPGRRYQNQCLEFIGHGAQALGVARGALEAARELAPRRVAYGGAFSADTPRFQ